MEVDVFRQRRHGLQRQLQLRCWQRPRGGQGQADEALQLLGVLEPQALKPCEVLALAMPWLAALGCLAIGSGGIDGDRDLYALYGSIFFGKKQHGNEIK